MRACVCVCVLDDRNLPKNFWTFSKSLLYQLLVHSWVRQIKKAKYNVAKGGGVDGLETKLLA